MLYLLNIGLYQKAVALWSFSFTVHEPRCIDNAIMKISDKLALDNAKILYNSHDKFEKEKYDIFFMDK